MSDPVRLGFICVRNAGRSQMATAFAERERDRRGLEADVEILTGGTDPAESVHEEVRETMTDRDASISGRVPRAVTTDELASCDVVATMGCSTLDLDAEASSVDVRDWALTDPEGKDPEEVTAIRDEVERRVVALFDEVVSDLEANTENDG